MRTSLIHEQPKLWREFIISLLARHFQLLVKLDFNITMKCVISVGYMHLIFRSLLLELSACCFHTLLICSQALLLWYYHISAPKLHIHLLFSNRNPATFYHMTNILQNLQIEYLIADSSYTIHIKFRFEIPPINL